MLLYEIAIFKTFQPIFMRKHQSSRPEQNTAGATAIADMKASYVETSFLAVSNRFFKETIPNVITGTVRSMFSKKPGLSHYDHQKVPMVRFGIR